MFIISRFQLYIMLGQQQNLYQVVMWCIKKVLYEVSILKKYFHVMSLKVYLLTLDTC